MVKAMDSTKWSGHSSNPESSSTFFNSVSFNDDPMFTDVLFRRIHDLTNKCFILNRVYANIQTAGQNGDFHQDDDSPNTWTFLLYMNSFSRGGETEFKTDKIHVQQPVRNMGILFDSRIFHRGKGPVGDGTRVTIAWKLIEVPKCSFFEEPVPHCIIRHYCNEEQLSSVWKELEFMKSRLNEPLLTGTARDAKKHPIKKNKGIFLEEAYKSHTNFSTIINLPIDSSLFVGKHWFYNYMLKCKIHSTLVSYYSDGDYYRPHSDHATVTCISYHWKEPKEFTGGELYFGDYMVPIENNSMLIFPSCVEHEVKTITGSGRYSITKFMDVI